MTSPTPSTTRAGSAPNKPLSEGGNTFKEKPMNTVVQLSDAATPASGALTPMDMLHTAVSTGAGIEVMERLLALQERWEAGQARKAFDAAVAEAKGDIPPILKDRKVGFESKRTNSTTNYTHESLAQIASVVDPILHTHGLSYRYKADQGSGGISVTCILSHRDGYSEETTLSAGADTSGQKNSIQAIGSTTTYLQRYTLKLALGLATTDRDDDGALSDQPQSSGAAEAAIEHLRRNADIPALEKWRADNDEAIKTFDRNDYAAVARAYREHYASLWGASE